jgi:3-oxoadipate enol-lactonase
MITPMPRIALPDVTLHVEDRGAGPVLLLVHGFPLDHQMWRYQAEAFSASHRLLIPDLRGFGQSGITPGVVTMERYADDLAALLDALEIQEPITLCGLSMGGYVAWQFALRHRARLGRLVLCDTRAAADTPAGALGRLENADRVLREGAHSLVAGMMEKLFAPATRQQQPEMVEATRQVMLAAAPDGIAAALRGMAERPDIGPRLGEIDVPALVVGGEEDAIVPIDEMRAMAAQLPRGTFVAVPGAGHMAPLEQPAAVNEALRNFLARGV